MQPAPNRLGLGLRPPMPSYGQGPSMSALAQQQSMQFPPNQSRETTLFVGSISGGITDSFLNDLLSACGPIKSFKRLITPANKPQGFGFVAFEDPDGALRALKLLNGVELPALEDGCANKSLLVKADEKTRVALEMYSNSRMITDADEAQNARARTRIAELVQAINQTSEDATNKGLLDREKYVIPPHLHDLQEADLPETQRGLVISEIAQFRERAAKKEREKLREQSLSISALPNGPKQREWGKPQAGSKERETSTPPKQTGMGTGAQGYSKPVNFVKSENGKIGEEEHSGTAPPKTDEELEEERKEARRREEDLSFRDRERRYEPRERARIAALERAITRERVMKEAEEKDRIEMRSRLDVWDDDQSDETFYVDRARWRASRTRRLAAEEAEDDKSRQFEEREAENLRRESEAFLARQMDEMQALADEQRKAGLLLDDGAPVKLSVKLAPAGDSNAAAKEKATVFGQDDEEEETVLKRKVPLVKLDFSVQESAEKAQERLEGIRASVPHNKEELFKAKVRWDGLSDSMIDRKFEPLIKKLMVKHLGEIDDDDLILFVVEHLKDHKSPGKLVDGLEPVLEEEATDFTISLWRQVIFESMAYGDGLHTEKMMVE